MDTKREALRRARVLRNEFRERGEFSQSEYRQALAGILVDLSDLAYDAFVTNVAQDIDRESSHDRGRSDPSFPEFDLEGEYKLGDTRRIAKRLARIEHADMAMAIDDQNVAAVLIANARKKEELSKLRPYWGAGISKQQAVEAYLESQGNVA